MGILGNLVRASGGYETVGSSYGWMMDTIGPRTASGERVTHTSAMTLSAYTAALRVISENLAWPPMVLRRRLKPRGRTDARDHPAWKIAHRQWTPTLSAYEGKRVMIHRALAIGNSYAEVERNGDGTPAGIWPIAPGRMRPRVLDDNKTLVYDWSRSGDFMSPEVTLPAGDVIHLRTMGTGIEGYPQLQLMAQSLGRGIAAQRHGASYFGEGATKRLLAIAKEKMNPKSREQLRHRIEGDRANDPVGARRIPILEGDVTITEMGVNPKDAQYIETEDLTVEDVARWFGLPLSKLGYDKRAKGWSTIDGEERAFVTGSLMPWATQVEIEFWTKLMTEEERDLDELYFQIVFQALLRGDNASRASFHKELFYLGAKSPNDIREDEDEDPIDHPNGDRYWLPANLMPLDSAAAPGEEKPDAPTPDEGDEDAPEDQGDEEDQQEDDAPKDAPEGAPDAPSGFPFGAIRPVVVDAVNRTIRKERHSLSRALKRHAGNQVAFDAWATEFYAKARTEFVASLAPAVAVLDMIGRCPNDGVVAHVASHTMCEPTGPGIQSRVEADEGDLVESVTNQVMNALEGAA